MENWDWSQIITTMILIVDYLIKIIAVGFVPEDREPSSSTAWLLIILILPIIGLPLYVIIGSPYLRGKRRKIQQIANKALATRLEPAPDYPAEFTPPAGLASIVAMNRTLTSFPATTGHHERVLSSAHESVAAMADAVAAATDTVHAEFYILALDDTTRPFFTAMADAARRGVNVKVLFDHLGTRSYPGYRAMKRFMDDAGIQWRAMMPLQPLRGHWRRPDLRNHRKLLVVDDVVGFLGSMNMIDPGYLKRSNRRKGLLWDDLNVEVRGPIVGQLAQVFALDWFQETDELVRQRDKDAGDPNDRRRVAPMQLVPSGPGFLTEPNLRMFTALAHMAQQELLIVSPYFVPDQAFMLAITSAAQRGVDVELFASEQADQFMVYHAQRSYYQELLDAGVRLQLYRKPVILHSKFMVVDRVVTAVGSSNLDMRSFFLDFEVTLMAVDGTLTTDLIDVVADYRENSFELTKELWNKRSWFSRYLDNVMRLTSALQ